MMDVRQTPALPITLTSLSLLLVSPLALAHRARAQDDTVAQPTRAAPTTATSPSVAAQPHSRPDTFELTPPRMLARDAPAAARPSSWYGWQTLAADAVSLGAMALGPRVDSVLLSLVGFVGLNVGAPFAHFGHDEGVRGYVSMGVRFGSSALILAGAVLVLRDAFSDTPQPDRATDLGNAFGLTGLLGIVTMIVLDAFSWTATERPVRSRPEARFQLAPYVTGNAQGTGLQLRLTM